MACGWVIERRSERGVGRVVLKRAVDWKEG